LIVQDDPSDADGVSAVVVHGESPPSPPWINSKRLVSGLPRKALKSGLPLADNLLYAVCARDTITHIESHDEVIVVTAQDIFGP
jgi:hypothetical protein